MDSGKLRKVMILGLAVYTVLILFFLFMGFNRANLVKYPEFRYNLIPDGISLHFPQGRNLTSFFDLGNFAAFIPFGIMIPLLYRCTFVRFISLFILSITALEVLQMLSRLGSFDSNDIILNTLGAAVGFLAQRLVRQDRNKISGIRKIIALALILSAGTFILIGGTNYYLDKAEGKVIALNELPLKEGSVVWDDNLSGFEVAHVKVGPRMNMYSSQNARTNEFTYLLEGNYKTITGYIAIPHNVTTRVDITFSADGATIYTLGFSENTADEHRFAPFQIPLARANELTIKINNDNSDSNAHVVMWDVAVAEVNKGKKIINGMKGRLESLF